MDEIKSKTLKNGLKIITAKDGSNPLISIQLYVRMGSCWETKEEAGFSHFTEHLLFKSTEKFPDGIISERASFLGGQLNAYTEFDSICFYLTLPSRFTDEGLDIISQLVLHSNYSDKDFSFERNVVIEELKQYRNDPEEFFIEEIPKYYLKKNPYRNPIIGNEEILNNATPNNLRSFYKKWVVPNNCFLVVSGDYDNDLMTQIESYFSEWQYRELIPRKIVNENYQTIPSVFSLQKDISNDYLAFVFPELSENNPDSHAQSLIIKAFAYGRNSQLYDRLFRKDKLIDTIKIHSLSGILNGMTILLILPKKNADLNKIIDSFLDEFNKLHHYGISQDEMNKQKTDLLYSHKYSFEYIESLALSIGSEELLGNYEDFIKYPDKLKGINRTIINQLISKFYSPEKLQILHLGKKKIDTDSILKKINLLKKKTIITSNTNDYCEKRLANGMKVIFKKVIGKPTIGIALTNEVSQLNETLENRGLNLLTSTMLIYGSKKKTHRELIDFCTAHGIQFGITASKEATTIRAKCFDDMLPITLEMIADIMKTPTFPIEHISNLKKTYISNINRIKDYPQQLAELKWKQMVFGKKSNLLSKEGLISDINKISRKKVIEWNHTYYGMENYTIAILGDFDFNETYYQIEELFNESNGNTNRLPQKLYIEPSINRNKRIEKNLDQSTIYCGGFGCTAEDTEMNIAFYVLSYILGGDINSRLSMELREKMGVAYSVGFDFNSLRKIGLFCGYAVVDKKAEKQSLDAIQRIMKDIKLFGITDKELEIAKNAIRGNRLMEEESVLYQAQSLAILETLGYGYQYYLDREKRLKNVTKEMIKIIAEKYFKPENYFINILS